MVMITGVTSGSSIRDKNDINECFRGSIKEMIGFLLGLLVGLTGMFLVLECFN